MISLMEALMWLEGKKSENDGRKTIDISDVEFMLNACDQDAVVSVDTIVMWHPEERFIRVVEENYNEDIEPEDKYVDIHFNSIDAMETMHLALGSLLKKHYETSLAKLK